jgi:DNA-binding transcriptional regulator YiaG
MNSLNAEVKSIRLGLNLSQRAIAELINSSRQKIADYERGRARLPADIYLRIKALKPKAQRGAENKNARKGKNTIPMVSAPSAT